MNCAGCISVVVMTVYVFTVLTVLSTSGLYAAGTALVFGSPLLLVSLLMAVAAQAGDPPDHK